MTDDRELQQQGSQHAGERRERFIDSYGFFALLVMSCFGIAIALEIVGLVAPAWLGAG